MERPWKLYFAVACLLLVARETSAVSRPPCNEQGAVRLTGAGEPIGLTGEGEPVGGRLEVCNGSEWGTVCNDGFHQVDAGVVCKQLGYSRHDAALLTHLPLDEVWKYTFMTEVACTGSESRLVDCQHSTDIRCDHSSDVGVNCSTTLSCVEEAIRLEDGNDTMGRVEVCLEEEWTTLCLESWSPSNARVVCRQLGYESLGQGILEHIIPGASSVPIYDKQFNCNGNETRILDCPQTASSTPCIHDNDLTLQCSSIRLCVQGEVRLVGGNDTGGRVELCMDEEWGTVCSDEWSNTNARVVCRQLGFSALTSFVPADAQAIPGSGLIHLRNVVCQGSEPNLLFCAHSNATDSCTHQTDAQVTCQSRVCENGEIRLADGLSPYEGRLEFCHNETWGTVCNDGWEMYNTKVACTQLGYGTEHMVKLNDNQFPAPAEASIHLDNVFCSGTESSLLDCPHDNIHNCGHHENVNIRCGQCHETNVTLTEAGDSQGEMRVEVCLNGRWGTVCGDGWDDRDALVICRQFNPDSNESVPSIRRNFPLLPVVAENVFCVGNESTFSECSYQHSNGTCPSRQVAGVQCSAQPRPTPVTSTPLPSNSTPVTPSPLPSNSTPVTPSPLPSCNFQLILSGNIVCDEWLMHNTGSKLEDLSQGLVLSLGRECECGLTSTSLSLKNPDCLREHQFVVSGLLASTDKAHCSEIMKSLQDWAGKGAEIVVEGVPLTVKECSVFLEEGEPVACSVIETVSPSPTINTPPPGTEGPTKALLHTVLLPATISVLVAILLAMVIILTCIVFVRVRNKKASVNLSEHTANAYNLVAVSGEYDVCKDIYDTPNTDGIYEELHEPSPPPPPLPLPNGESYPADPNPYLTTTFKPSTQDDEDATRQQYMSLKPRDEQDPEPGASLYAYIDTEEISGPEYAVPPLEDNATDSTTSNSHYQSLMLVPAEMADADTYTVPETFLPSSQQDAAGTSQPSPHRNYTELIIEAKEHNGEYASLNI